MSKEIQNALDTEIDKYGDIIKADGFIDSYNNITLKAMHTLKFFLNKGNFLPSASKNVIRPFNIKCYSWLYDSFFAFSDMFTSPAPEYLFKADDDVFVNLPLLYKKLCGPYEMGRSARGPYDNVTNLLIGNLYEGNRTKVRKVGNDILNLSTI